MVIVSPTVSCPSEIEQIRSRIIKEVRVREAKYRELRKKEGKNVVGAANLCSQPYMRPHMPKKRERKIFLVCRNRKRRKKLLYLYRKLFEYLRDSYCRAKEGEAVEWPPGRTVHGRRQAAYTNSQADRLAAVGNSNAGAALDLNLLQRC